MGQEQQARPAGLDQLGHAGDVVDAQIILHDHVAGHEYEAEHVLEAGRTAVPIQGSVYTHHDLQAVDGQRADHLHRGVHAQGLHLAFVRRPPGAGLGASESLVFCRRRNLVMNDTLTPKRWATCARNVAGWPLAAATRLRKSSE